MDKVIIDVGAYKTGVNGKQYKSVHHVPVIYIEPDLDTFNQLQIDSDDVKLPIAIHDHDGITIFNFYQTGTHSVLPTNLKEIHHYIDGYSGQPGRVEDWKAWKKLYVPCLTLKTLIDQMGVKEVVALKIDTQGFDFEVIKSLGDAISIVKEVKCEVQITSHEVYLGQSKKEDVVEYMKEHGFTLVDVSKQTFDQEENLTFKRI